MRLYTKCMFVGLLLALQACSDDKKVVTDEINVTKEVEISNELIEQVSKEKPLYEIDKKKYYVDSLPKEYKEISGEERFHFLKNYVNYQIILDSLAKEQTKYAKNIEKNREKALDLIRKKGDNISKLDKSLLFKKMVIDTIAVELLAQKDKNLNAKIEAFYKKNRELYIYPNTVEISSITSKTKEEAEALVTKLKKEKVDIKRFTSFSNRYSSSPKLRKDYGYIGRISNKSADSKLFQTLWDSNITEGFLDEIISLDKIYTVIYIHKKEKAFTQTLEKEREEIQKYLLYPKIKKWMNKRLKEIMKTKEVKIYDDFKDDGL